MRACVRMSLLVVSGWCSHWGRLSLLRESCAEDAFPCSNPTAVPSESQAAGGKATGRLKSREEEELALEGICTHLANVSTVLRTDSLYILVDRYIQVILFRPRPLPLDFSELWQLFWNQLTAASKWQLGKVGQDCSPKLQVAPLFSTSLAR